MGTRGRGMVALAAVVAAAVGAGCGSSDDEGLSKAEFVKQADAICAKGDKRIEAVAEKTFAGGKQPDKAEITKFISDTALPETRKQIEGIEDLDPPKDDEDEVNAITDAANEAIEKIEANPELGAQEGADDPFAKATKLAREYGLKDCGSS